MSRTLYPPSPVNATEKGKHFSVLPLENLNFQALPTLKSGHFSQQHKLQNDAGNTDDCSGNQQVCIVDDVLTSGATLYACMLAIRNAVPDVRLSFATLAVTQHITQM